MSSTFEPQGARRREMTVIRPLFAAGFVTAFGAHSIAANLGASPDLTTHLLALAVLLALYDGAEVLLKPVFGSRADRIGPRPVLLGGLLGFAAASAAFVLAGNPAWLGLARFGQGAAAAAFSPAAGAMIARIAPDRRRGRAFGSYGPPGCCSVHVRCSHAECGHDQTRFHQHSTTARPPIGRSRTHVLDRDDEFTAAFDAVFAGRHRPLRTAHTDRSIADAPARRQRGRSWPPWASA